MSSNFRKQQSFQLGAVILLFSTIAVKIIGAIFKIPLSGDICLGDLGFGYFSSAYDLFTPIYSLAMAGLPIAVAKIVAVQMAENRYKDVRQTLKVTQKLFLITGLSAFVLMLVLIRPFVSFTDPTGETVYSLFAIAPSLLFCCIMSTYRGYYEGLRNMYPTAISDIIGAFGKLVLGFGFAYFTVKFTANPAFGAAAAMVGITASTMVSALYLKIRYNIKGDGITEAELQLSPKPSAVKESAKAIILIAVPVMLSSLASNVATLVDVTMVKWQISDLLKENSSVILDMYSSSINEYNSSSAANLTVSQIPTFLYGIRGKAFTLYNLAGTLTAVLGVSALPVLAQSWVSGEKAVIKNNIESMLKLITLITVPIACGLIAIPKPIMSLLYSSLASAEIGGPVLQIFGFAALFSGIAMPLTNMLQAIGKQVCAFRNIAIGSVIKIIVNFIAVSIPQVNIKGAAVGTLACFLFIFIANLLSLIKATGICPNILKVFVKPLMAGFACAVTAFFICCINNSALVTVISILASGIIYIVALVLLNCFEKSDILALPFGEKVINFCEKYRIVR